MEYSKELGFTISTVKEAGKILMKMYGKAHRMATKKLVTDADISSNDYIIRRIKRHYPDYNIESEESGTIDKKSNYKWIVDPLCGTYNYLRNFPYFGISMSLEYKKEPVVGVAYDPCRDELFYGSVGNGAYLNEKRIQVSNVDKLPETCLAIGVEFHAEHSRDFVKKMLNELYPPVIRRFKINQCAALDISYVAAERIDAYIHPTEKHYDMSAGGLIVKEAGGRVTNLSGEYWDPYTEGIIATNGKIHDEILKMIEEII